MLSLKLDFETHFKTLFPKIASQLLILLICVTLGFISGGTCRKTSAVNPLSIHVFHVSAQMIRFSKVSFITH